MTAVFDAFILDPPIFLKIIGIGMAAAVIIDATVVADAESHLHSADVILRNIIGEPSAMPSPPRPPSGCADRNAKWSTDTAMAHLRN